MKEAYNEGYAAAQAGQSFLSNPYSPHSDEWEAWNTGFTDGED